MLSVKVFLSFVHCSQFVKGIVCEKNVAHKRMKTNIENPRLLVLRCALDFAPCQLSSVKTILEEVNSSDQCALRCYYEGFSKNAML